MLTKIADNYRIVNPHPSDELITHRREAIAEFVKQLETPETRYACAEIALVGFRSALSDSQSNASKLLIAAIQDKQPSFSTDLRTNELEVRICAGLALGEYISSQKENAADVAALCVAAAAQRPLPSERHLAAFVSELLSEAKDCLTSLGKARRLRIPLPRGDVQATDLAVLARSVNAILSRFSEVVTNNERANAEELDVLWWVFGGRSVTTGKQFSSMDTAQRSLLVGSELAERTIVPALDTSRHFISRLVGTDSPLSVQHLAHAATREILTSITRHAAKISDVVAAHPSVLPLTWLFGRLLDSDLAPGWETEFEQKTKIPPSLELNATAWSEQILNENVAAALVALSNHDSE